MLCLVLGDSFSYEPEKQAELSVEILTLLLQFDTAAARHQFSIVARSNT